MALFNAVSGACIELEGLVGGVVALTKLGDGQM